MVKIFCGAWRHGRKRGRKGRETRRTVVLKELFDEIDVREDHPPAAIALQLELIKRISVGRKEESRGQTQVSG